MISLLLFTTTTTTTPTTIAETSETIYIIDQFDDSDNELIN